MGWIRRWDERHPDGIDLAARDSGQWTVTLWFNLASWGLGVEGNREFGGGLWSNRLCLSIIAGPFALAAVRKWPT